MNRRRSGAGSVARVLAALALCAGAAHAAADDAAAGQALYRDGVLASGQALTGVAGAGVLRLGRDAACAACHRRSGFGIAEGKLVVRPISAPDLYHNRAPAAASPRIAHQLGTPRRPAYTDAGLASAIRSGVDVTGHLLDPAMPRYRLDAADMANLLAYLKTLYAQPDPGVSDDEIRLATVIQPGVEPARRRALLEVMQAFVRDKNAGVRSELARRRGGAMRMHRAYRSWVLEVWELDGAPSGWGAQLDAHYRRAPVFALVGGVGERDWQPIHDFSERHRVPCILPLTALPGQGSNFYTVYFSRGIALEAQALAAQVAGAGSRVVQVYRRDDALAVAAVAAFRAAWTGPPGALEEQVLSGPEGPAQWAAAGAGDKRARVLWLRDADLGAASLAGAPTYLSASLLGEEAATRLAGARVAYPWELPALRAPRVKRSVDWLRARGLGDAWRGDQVNTLFALTMVGEALAHLMDSFSRDYLVETIEHQVSTSLLASYYPPLTLGPDQRHASKGVYLLGGPGSAPQLIVP